MSRTLTYCSSRPSNPKEGDYYFDKNGNQNVYVNGSWEVSPPATAGYVTYTGSSLSSAKIAPMTGATNVATTSEVEQIKEETIDSVREMVGKDRKEITERLVALEFGVASLTQMIADLGEKLDNIHSDIKGQNEEIEYAKKAADRYNRDPRNIRFTM